MNKKCQVFTPENYLNEKLNEGVKILVSMESKSF